MVHFYTPERVLEECWTSAHEIFEETKKPEYKGEPFLERVIKECIEPYRVKIHIRMQQRMPDMQIAIWLLHTFDMGIKEDWRRKKAVGDPGVWQAFENQYGNDDPRIRRGIRPLQAARVYQDYMGWCDWPERRHAVRDTNDDTLNALIREYEQAREHYRRCAGPAAELERLRLAVRQCDNEVRNRYMMLDANRLAGVQPMPPAAIQMYNGLPENGNAAQDIFNFADRELDRIVREYGLLRDRYHDAQRQGRRGTVEMLRRSLDYANRMIGDRLEALRRGQGLQGEVRAVFDELANDAEGPVQAENPEAPLPPMPALGYTFLMDDPAKSEIVRTCRDHQVCLLRRRYNKSRKGRISYILRGDGVNANAKYETMKRWDRELRERAEAIGLFEPQAQPAGLRDDQAQALANAREALLLWDRAGVNGNVNALAGLDNPPANAEAELVQAVANHLHERAVEAEARNDG